MKNTKEKEVKILVKKLKSMSYEDYINLMCK